MLKRICVLTLLLLYLVTASGFAVNLHYCGNIISAVKIDAPAKPAKMACKMKCCRDQHLDVKVKDAHQGQSTSFLSKIFAFELPRIPFEDYFLSAQNALLEKFFDRGPPLPLNSIATWLRNCVFRI